MEREELHLSWKDQFFISPLGQWIDQHRNLLLNAGTVVLVVVIWTLVQTTRAHNVDAMRQVNEAFIAWKAKPEDEQLYRNLVKSLNKEPSMRLAMRGEMAQMLLNIRCDEAEKMVQEPMQELRSIAPFHAEFAEISFLIGRKLYQEALERSVSLKEKMLCQKTVLAGRNLLRIALLQQQLGNPAGEMAAWKDWDEHIETQNNKTLREQTLKGLGDQTISFQCYINERKARL